MPVYKDTTKTKDGRQWYFVISYTTLDGRYKNYKSKKFKTKREAELEESKFLLDKGYADTDKITFSVLIDHYLTEKENTLKPRTLERYKNHFHKIDNLLGHIEVKALTKVQYDEFRNIILDSDFAISSKNTIFMFVKSLINYGSLHFDIYNSIPFKYLPLKDNRIKTMDFYTLDEFNQFISVADDIRYKGMFITLFYCGLRLGEANALLFSDINFKAGEIAITKTVTTKAKDKQGNYLVSTPKTKGSIRTLPLPNVVLNTLKQLYDYYSKFEEFNTDWYVFGGLRPIPQTTLDNAKKRYCKQANIKEIRIHDFRHSAASLMANNGASIMLLSRYLGHSSIKQTLDRYAHLYASEMDSLVDKINKL